MRTHVNDEQAIDEPDWTWEQKRAELSRRCDNLIAETDRLYEEVRAEAIMCENMIAEANRVWAKMRAEAEPTDH